MTRTHVCHHPPGARVATRRPIVGDDGRTLHGPGAIGIVTAAAGDSCGTCRVRFCDGFELQMSGTDLLAADDATTADGLLPAVSVPVGALSTPIAGAPPHATGGLFDRVILRCVVGSRAFGLARENSDFDRRGVYLPPAHRHWSLEGVPGQLEYEPGQEVYWELQKFLVLALKSNPNILECLWSPLVETVTPLGAELLALRESFLSRIAYQTFSGYATSQFRKIEADQRNQGRIKWKHAMHLLRLLLSGIHLMKYRSVLMETGTERERLLAIRDGEVAWAEADAWRVELQREFEQACASTSLPESPDHVGINRFLVRARRLAIEEQLP